MKETNLILVDQDGAILAQQLFAPGSGVWANDSPRVFSVSVPIPQGRLAEPLPAMLEMPGCRVLVQTDGVGRWSDGSVRWLRMDFALKNVGALPAEWPVRLLRDWPAPRDGPTLKTALNGNQVHIDTGIARFQLDRHSAAILCGADIGDASMPGTGAKLSLSLTDAAGKRMRPGPVTFEVETFGPVRASFCANSKIPGTALNLVCRTSFFAGSGLLKLEVGLHNTRAARHRHGLWDLGDPGSFRFRDFSLEFGLSGAIDGKVHWTTDDLTSLSPRPAQHLMLHQASSGSANWNSPNHVNAAGVVACSFRGYRLETDGASSSGLRALPTLVWRTDCGLIGFHIPEFWQQSPKSLRFEGRSVRIGLFPLESDEVFELQGGERKTHTVWLQFAPSSTGVETVAAELRRAAVRTPILRPLVGATTPFGDGVDLSADDRSHVDPLLQEALSGPRGILANREAADEYGWRHFGEIVADHEQAYYSGPEPLISHYNNQFDFVYGLLLNYLRTGNEQLFELGDALARHVVDIDIYHTLEDRSAYSGGMFWHTDHYRNAFTATHRAYSLRNKPAGADYGGGPSCEHNYTTGLYLHYCLTGARASRDAVVSLADWVLRMDDGGLTPWRFFDSSPTGWASATREENFHGPGRGAGNSINALLDAWSLTGSAHYLEYAERLIRRCIHPQDDIAALELLDFEARWSYTVFLTALLKYLDLKASADTYDRMFHYGRASLRHYARWMTDNEVPYFDRPGQMEFPTETWAAQELRKANVLRLAAAWVDEPWKSRMFETGGRLAERAWQDLQRFETRSCARPLAILMVEALKERDAAPPTRTVPNAPPPGGFGPPTAFVTQKQRVKAMLRSPRAALKGLAHLLNYPFRRSGSAAS